MSTAPARLIRAPQESVVVSTLIAATRPIAETDTESESESNLSDLDSLDLESADLEVVQPPISTTRLGLQRSEGLPDTYVPGTVPERLYKRAQLAHDTVDSAYQLTPDVFAPTPAELRAVAAEVGDEALTNAIAAIKVTGARSGRRSKPTSKVIINKVSEQEQAAEE